MHDTADNGSTHSMRLLCSGMSRWFREQANIITSTPFLASVTAHQYANLQMAEGLESWSRPGIYSVGAWLATCWQQARYSALDVPTLLSPAQERALWHRIIERDGSSLFDTNAGARLASSAAKLMAEWQISSDGEIWSNHQDAKQFQRWSSSFRQACEREGWITRADLWRRVPEWTAAGMVDTTRTVFAGFQHIHPALRKVMTALGDNAVEEPFREARLGEIPTFERADLQDEIQNAARWARFAYEERGMRSVGVGIPELASHRAQVERAFTQVFYPSRFRLSQKVRPAAANTPHSVFHLGARKPLSDEPVVASALLFLELAKPRIHHADASAILRSPFLAGAVEERDRRAQADFGLRRKRELDYSLRDIEYAARECPKLSAAFLALRRVLDEASHKLEAGDWARFISGLLGALGWPGEQSSETGEETFEAWEDGLSRLAALGLVLPPMSLDECLGQLRRILNGPGREIGDLVSPVQVLDVSEMRGLEFDCALITGMSDQTWPPPLRTSPLVPLTLQRAHNVPGSTPASAKQERQDLTRRLLSAAPEMAISYSGRISPLVEPFTRSKQGQVMPRWEGVLPQTSFAVSPLEEVEDTFAPKFTQAETTRGGTSIIKAQSQCPFRAFAEFRLGARSPDDASFGLDSRERGGFLHKALQNVWAELKTHERLTSMSDDELVPVVRAAIKEAVKTNENGALHILLSDTERARLEEVILDWLTKVERVRSIPFTVEGLEQERHIVLGGLGLKLRVDRTDRLKDGKILLFDYKSGAQTKNKLDVPRPQEPQLLLYAAAMNDAVDGLFFGEMRARKTRAVGYSRKKYFAGSGATTPGDWDDFLEQSKTEMERLAEQFVSGYAAVDPLKNACEFCSLNAFCRVNEGARGTGEEEE